MQSLRCALDWCTLLYLTHVSGQVWKALLKLTKAGEFGILDLVHGEQRVACRVREVSGGAAVILQGFGFWVKVANPFLRAQRAAKATGKLYGVEMQVQGTALSASTTGLDVVAWGKAALEAALYRHAGPTPEARAETLKTSCFPGRWDVAVDVALKCPVPQRSRDAPLPVADPQTWIDSEIFADGNLDDANARVSTRARKPKAAAKVKPDYAESETAIGTRMVGKQATGRTLYRGGSIVELCIYERARKLDGDWKILEGTLKGHCGWDGRSPVMRFEVRCMRPWFRDQKVKRGTEWVRGDELYFDEWLELVPEFAGTVLGRFRHTKNQPGVRTRDREDSSYYEAVRGALPLLSSAARVAEPIALVVSKKREVAAERAESRACGAITDIMALRGVSMKEAFVMLRDGEMRDRAEHWHLRFMQTRVRYGLDPGLDMERLLGPPDSTWAGMRERAMAG